MNSRIIRYLCDVFLQQSQHVLRRQKRLIKHILEILNIDIDTSYDILIFINSEILEVVGMFMNLKFGNFNSVHSHAE